MGKVRYPSPNLGEGSRRADEVEDLGGVNQKPETRNQKPETRNQKFLNARKSQNN